MVLLLFLSIFLLNEVHGDYEIVRGCPSKDAQEGEVVEYCNFFCGCPSKDAQEGEVVEYCNFFCGLNDQNQTQEGYYTNGTRCKITHIPGVPEGVCIDLLGMEGCRPLNETFTRRFMKFWAKRTTTPTTGTQETNPTTIATTTTTTRSSTTTKSKSTKKPKKTKKTRRPKTKTPKTPRKNKTKKTTETTRNISW
uniref:Putative basic tail protein n=1 Tax=Amblyomma cajennense TaxID=34607 RepID=A0A023FQP5_AMBCJ